VILLIVEYRGRLHGVLSTSTGSIFLCIFLVK
jgi:hypothetical protein